MVVNLLNSIEKIERECHRLRQLIMQKEPARAVEGFADFWKAYPNTPHKRNITDAEGMWKEVVKKEDVPLIMKALKETTWPLSTRYIPSPQRWLWNKKWTEKKGETDGKYRGLDESI